MATLSRKLVDSQRNRNGNPGLATSPEPCDRGDDLVTSTEDMIAEAHPDIEGEPKQFPKAAAAATVTNTGEGQKGHILSEVVQDGLNADAGRMPDNVQKDYIRRNMRREFTGEHNGGFLIPQAHEVDRLSSSENSEWLEQNGKSNAADVKHEAPFADRPYSLRPREREEVHLLFPRLLQGEFLVYPSRHQEYNPDTDHSHLHRQRYSMFQRLQHLEKSDEEHPKDGQKDATLKGERDRIIALIAKLQSRLAAINNMLNTRL